MKGLMLHSFGGLTKLLGIIEPAWTHVFWGQTARNLWEVLFSVLKRVRVYILFSFRSATLGLTRIGDSGSTALRRTGLPG